MGRLAQLDGPTLINSAAQGALTLSYCIGPPGRRRAETDAHHCLVIPVQKDPLRVITTRDGMPRRFTLTQGDIALAPQGSHTIWEWLDPAEIVLIRLDPDALRRFIELDMRLILTGNTLENEVTIHDPDLAGAAIQLHRASRQDEVGSEILFEALARVFLVTLVRRYGQYDANATRGFDLEDYTAILTYIESRLERRITPKKMAEIIGVSEATFSRKFKERTGQSPMAFVKEARLKAALVHLHENDLTLGEIAIRCGFADQAHFSRVFKSAQGKTPSQYRKAIIK
ncbi:MAG: AraC family transcriptional regulator [Pseudomonadota bacterium]